MAEELEIEIDKSGRVMMRTHGVKGPACMELSDWLAQIVGREQSREKTIEFVQGDTQIAVHHVVKQRSS